MILKDNFILANKVKMPKLGFGTWKLNREEECINAVKWALEAKIRLIDTAWVYDNHEFIGKAIKESNIKRSDIFITSKIWDNKPKLTKEAAKETVHSYLKELQIDYLDLVLIHWPFKSSLIMWEALEELYKEGIIKSIGVSNFTVIQLEDFCKKVKIKPMVNQIQYHLHLQRNEIVKYCQKNNIVVTSWQTIDKGQLLNDKQVIELAKKYNTTPACLCFKWAIQNDIAIIPKSVKKERIFSNIKLDDFNISKEDMDLLNSYPDNEKDCVKLGNKSTVKSDYQYNKVIW